MRPPSHNIRESLDVENLTESMKRARRQHAQDILQWLSGLNIYFDYYLKARSSSYSSSLFIDCQRKKEEVLAVLQSMPEVFVEMQSEAALLDRDLGADESVLRDTLMAWGLPNLQTIVRAVCPHYCQGILSPPQSSARSRVRKSCSLAEQRLPTEFFFSSQESKPSAEKDTKSGHIASIKRRRAGFFFENIYSAAAVCRVLSDVGGSPINVHIANFNKTSTRIWRDYSVWWDPVHAQDMWTGPGCHSCAEQNVRVYKAINSSLPGIRTFAASMIPFSHYLVKDHLMLLTINISTLRRVRLYRCQIDGADSDAQGKLTNFLVANRVMSLTAVSKLVDTTDSLHGEKGWPPSQAEPTFFSLAIDRDRDFRKFLVHARNYFTDEKDFEERFLAIGCPQS